MWETQMRGERLLAARRRRACTHIEGVCRCGVGVRACLTGANSRGTRHSNSDEREDSSSAASARTRLETPWRAHPQRTQLVRCGYPRWLRQSGATSQPNLVIRRRSTRQQWTSDARWRSPVHTSHDGDFSAHATRSGQCQWVPVRRGGVVSDLLEFLARSTRGDTTTHKKLQRRTHKTGPRRVDFEISV